MNKIDLYLCSVCDHMHFGKCEFYGIMRRKVCEKFYFGRCELVNDVNCPLCNGHVYQDEFGSFYLNSECRYTQEYEQEGK